MKIVQDDVSRFGLRRVHVVDGRQLTVDSFAVPEGWRVVDHLLYEEEEIRMWHLWLFMKRLPVDGCRLAERSEA